MREILERMLRGNLEGVQMGNERVHLNQARTTP